MERGYNDITKGRERPKQTAHYKILTSTLVFKLMKACQGIISKNQSGFVEGRHLRDSVR